MYNSTNLPLSWNKIFKKTIGSLFSRLGINLIVCVVMFSTFYSIITKNDETLSSISPLIGFLLDNLQFIVIGGILAFFLGMIIYQYFYYKLYYYKFEEEQAEIKKGVISQAKGVVRYERLQNIYVDQDFLDRLFGLYDVHFETAGELSNIYSHVDGLNKSNADKLLAFLTTKLKLGSKNYTKQIENDIPGENSKSEKAVNNHSLSNISISLKTITVMSLSVCLTSFLVLNMFFWMIYTLLANNLLVDNFDSSYFPGGIVITVIILVLSMLLGKWYGQAYYKNFHFKFEPEQLMISKGVISKSTIYLYYEKIQNVSVTQRFIERLFHIFDIQIDTAGASSNLGYFEEKEALAIKDFLLQKAKIYKRGSGL
ncbi:MAG: PH domain-containing protein [Candidatus Parcubacteria bacterium]|nr:PH domain-containing protein [Candidatus Parcubacteria bacterium]